MAKFKSLSFWYGLLLMVLTVSFTACVDDNDDTKLLIWKLILLH